MDMNNKRLMRDTIRKEICDKYGSCQHCPLDLECKTAECILTQLDDEILEDYKNTPVKFGKAVLVNDRLCILVCDHEQRKDWVNLVDLGTGIGLGEFQCTDTTIGALEAFYETEISLS